MYDNMLHSKSIVIDGEWATIGSSNMDNYSFFFNYEANIASTDPKFSQEIVGHFINDLFTAKEIVYGQWKKRPIYQKFLEFISTPFARFL